jgi:molecular chaperone HscA
VFTNYSEQQTGMVIHVVQGERELAGDNRSLARFELKGIPRLPPSMARVEVTLPARRRRAADGDRARADDRRQAVGRGQADVRALDEEVDRLVIESLDHAGGDYAARNRAEARVELGRVVLAVRTALAEVGHIEGCCRPTTAWRSRCRG